MTKVQKVALRHAANAIEGLRPLGPPVRLGADTYIHMAGTTDDKGRILPAVYLARRALAAAEDNEISKESLQYTYGLSLDQGDKLDRIAMSTHNIVQRAQRIARFLRNVAQNPDYIGRKRVY